MTDQTLKELRRRVEVMKKKLIIPRSVPIEEDLTTSDGMTKHVGKVANSYIEASGFENGYQKSIDDVLAILDNIEEEK